MHLTHLTHLAAPWCTPLLGAPQVWLDDTIQSSRRFYSVCHSLYAHIGDAAGLSLLLEIVPMWSLGGIICSFDGVPRSHDRSNAAHPDIVDSAWVRSVPAQNPQHEVRLGAPDAPAS